MIGLHTVRTAIVTTVTAAVPGLTVSYEPPTDQMPRAACWLGHARGFLAPAAICGPGAWLESEWTSQLVIQVLPGDFDQRLSTAERDAVSYAQAAIDAIALDPQLGVDLATATPPLSHLVVLPGTWELVTGHITPPGAWAARVELDLQITTRGTR